MGLRRVSLALGAIALIGLVAGIVSLAVFAAGDGKSSEVRALERCRALADQGELEEALSDCDLAIDEDEGLVSAYVQRALIYIELDEYHEALDETRSAIKLDEDNASAWAVQARARLGLGQHDQAAEDAQRAADGSDLTADESFALAGTYRALGHWREAGMQAEEACDGGLETACDFSAIPTREEGLDLLHRWTLTEGDVPASMVRGPAGYHSAAEESETAWAGYAAQPEEWGLLLAYTAVWYEPEASEGLLQVFSETWLLDGSTDLAEVLRDVSSAYWVFPSNADDDFPDIGDESRAGIVEEPPESGWQVPTASYRVLFLTGPFLTFINATFAGEPDRDQVAELARTIDSKIRGD
jgi:tetratricopeptide (TPR) repeat protein